MADLRIRSDLSRAALRLLAAAAGLLGVAASVTTTAHADTVAYLVNVTVRPDYHFANAEAALASGNIICDKLAAGASYAQIMGEVKADFANPDEYQASYLITQAANELCPHSIWQLRNSAAQYRRPAPPIEGD